MESIPRNQSASLCRLTESIPRMTKLQPLLTKKGPQAATCKRHSCYTIEKSQWACCARSRAFTTFRILEISYISNVFFVSYTIRKWPKFREIIRNFSMQIYTKFRSILRNSVTCYTNFFNDSAQTTFSTHSRETSRRWLGWGRYDNTPLNPYPFTAASRVFTTFFVYSKFRMFRMFFFVSYTIRKYTFRIRIQISISFVFIQF